MLIGVIIVLTKLQEASVTMKKIFSILALLFIAFLTSCTLSDNNKVQSSESLYGSPLEAELTPIERPFAMEYDERGRHFNFPSVCYSDENTLVISNVNVTRGTDDPGVVIEPEFRTDGIYIINTETGEYEKFNILHKDEIYQAVPYKDGIIYSCCRYRQDAESSLSKTSHEWEIAYFDGDESCVIDSGLCSVDDSPRLVSVNGIPVYVCENNTFDSSSVTLRRIDGMKASVIKDFDGFKFSFATDMRENGREYCFKIIDEKSDKEILFAGDESGILVEKELSEGCDSYGITDKYIVCSLGAKMGETSLLGIPIGGGEERLIEQSKRWYRIEGGRGKYCLTVDEGFNLYYIDIEASSVGQVTLPEDLVRPGAPKGLFGEKPDSFILEAELEDYFRLELQISES